MKVAFSVLLLLGLTCSLAAALGAPDVQYIHKGDLQIHDHVVFLEDHHVDLLKPCHDARTPCRFRRDLATDLHEHLQAGKVLVRLPHSEDDPDVVAIKVREVHSDETHYHFTHDRATFIDVYSSINIDISDNEDPEHHFQPNDHKDLTSAKRAHKAEVQRRATFLTSVKNKMKNFAQETASSFDLPVAENQPNPTRRTLPERPSMRFIRFGPYFRFGFRSLKLAWTFSGGLDRIEVVLGIDASFKARMRQSAMAKFPKLSMSFWEDSKEWPFDFTLSGLPVSLKLTLDRKLTFDIAMEDPNKFDMEVQGKGNLDVGFKYEKGQYPRLIFKKSITYSRGGFAVEPSSKRKITAQLILSNEFSTVLTVGYSILSIDINAPTFIVNPSLNFEARLAEGWNASTGLQIGVKYKVPSLIKFIFKTLAEYSKYKDWQWVFVRRNITYDPPAIDVSNVISNPTTVGNVSANNITDLDDSSMGVPSSGASGYVSENYTTEYVVTFQSGDADQAAAIGATVFIQFLNGTTSVSDRFWPKRDSDPLARKQFATLTFMGPALNFTPTAIIVGKDLGDDYGCDFEQPLASGVTWEKEDDAGDWYLDKLYLSYRPKGSQVESKYIAYVNDFVGVSDSDDYFGTVRADLLGTNSTLEDQRSYQVELSTSYTSGSGTSARVRITICGTTNICANKYVTGDDDQFRAGVTFRTWLDSNDVGTPASMTVSVTPNNAGINDDTETPDWLLETVKITYRNVNYFASFNQQFNAATQTATRTVSTTAPAEATYTITLKTTVNPESGTDADVSVTLGGVDGIVTLPLVPGDKFVSDEIMVYSLGRSRWLNWRPRTNSGIVSIGALRNLTVTVADPPATKVQKLSPDLELAGIAVSVDVVGGPNFAYYFDLSAATSPNRTIGKASSKVFTSFVCAQKSQVDYRLRKTESVFGRIANSVRFSDRDKLLTNTPCP